MVVWALVQEYFVQQLERGVDVAHSEPTEVLEVQRRVSRDSQVAHCNKVRLPPVFAVPDHRTSAVRHHARPARAMVLKVTERVPHRLVDFLGRKRFPLALMLRWRIGKLELEEMLVGQERGQVLSAGV